MSSRIRLLPLAVLLALALPSAALAGGHGRDHDHGHGHGHDYGHGHDHGKPPWAPGPGAPYQAAVLGDQPSAYWRLGEAPGATVAADQKHQFDGTYVGGPTLGVAHPLGGSGGRCGHNADDDTSADFDGLVTQPLGQWIDVADGGALAFPGRAAFSLEAWIHPHNLNTVTRRVFSKEGPDGGYLIGVRSDGLFFSRYANGLWTTLQTTADPVNWTHVLATYDGTTMRLYVNGALAAERASALELPAERKNLSIGAKQGDWRYFAGGLDEVAIYDHALSGDRAYAHWRVGTGSS